MRMRYLLPLAAALALSPRAGYPLPLIHEVFYDAEGSDSALVFTELSGTPGTLLDGYQLVGIDGGTGLVYRTIDLTGAVIPADGLLVIATTRAIDEVLAQRDFIADVDWQNGPDAIQLWNPFGVVLDALQYGDAGAFLLGEGAFAPDAPSGFSLTRDLLSADTGDNFADFLVGEPTPGAGLRQRSVPEPGSWMVLTLGAVGFFARAGRAPRARAA